MEEKKKWEKPELIVLCEAAVSENVLGSGSSGICFDEYGNQIPC